MKKTDDVAKVIAPAKGPLPGPVGISNIPLPGATPPKPIIKQSSNNGLAGAAAPLSGAKTNDKKSSTRAVSRSGGFSEWVMSSDEDEKNGTGATKDKAKSRAKKRDASDGGANAASAKVAGNAPAKDDALVSSKWDSPPHRSRWDTPEEERRGKQQQQQLLQQQQQQPQVKKRRFYEVLSKEPQPFIHRQDNNVAGANQASNPLAPRKAPAGMFIPRQVNKERPLISIALKSVTQVKQAKFGAEAGKLISGAINPAPPVGASFGLAPAGGSDSLAQMEQFLADLKKKKGTSELKKA